MIVPRSKQSPHWSKIHSRQVTNPRYPVSGPTLCHVSDMIGTRVNLQTRRLLLEVSPARTQTALRLPNFVARHMLLASSSYTPVIVSIPYHWNCFLQRAFYKC